LRTIQLEDNIALSERAAQIACADVVLTSCAVTSLLAAFCGVPLVALGLSDDQLPERDVIRHLGDDDLRSLSEADVLQAMGF
jgi:hypothetical protein